MEPVVIAIIAAFAGLLVGYGVGRSSGVSAGHAAGRQEGLERGRVTALEEGRTLGLADGRAQGREEGREQGRAEGLEQGRREGREEGRREGHASGFEAGRSEGFEAGRVDGLEQGRRESGEVVRDAERRSALREAVGRVSAFLKSSVQQPLAGAAPDADADELRERIGRALGALEDVDFFITDVDVSREGTDLTDLAGDVAREFAADQDVGVRLMLATPVVRADVNRQALLDALYLVLHNAARFGGGTTIDLIVREADGRAEIVVRDRGEGFSEEAFARAFDPFYSTSPEGLGLGLPHTRGVVEGMGGSVSLRNVPDGGAEVELSFPLA